MLPPQSLLEGAQIHSNTNKFFIEEFPYDVNPELQIGNGIIQNLTESQMRISTVGRHKLIIINIILCIQ